jgi:hypothetical protein
MATWMVSGADRDTDVQVEIELSAPDEASALLAALRRGVYVARIRRVSPPAAAARPAGPKLEVMHTAGARSVAAPAAVARHAATEPPQAAARNPVPLPSVAKAPARGPAQDAPPIAAPTGPRNPVTPTAQPRAAEPTRVAAAPRRVQVRRAPAELLPRAFADALSVPQPPFSVPLRRSRGTRR